MRRYVGAVFFAVSILMGGLGVLLLLPFSRRRMPTQIMQLWGKSYLWVAGVKIRIRGLEHIDPTKPSIYMSNHTSVLDIPVLIAALPVHLRFIYKHSLGYVPLVGWAMRLMGMVPINRSDRTKAIKSLRRAGRLIRSGFHVLIFPEGTRSRDGALLPFKKGGFALSTGAGLDVVPITLRNSRRLCGRNSLLARGGTLEMLIHPRIEVTQTHPPRAELMRSVRERIQSGLGARVAAAVDA